jgi:hypothetical protein
MRWLRRFGRRNTVVYARVRLVPKDSVVELDPTNIHQQQGSGESADHVKDSGDVVAGVGNPIKHVSADRGTFPKLDTVGPDSSTILQNNFTVHVHHDSSTRGAAGPALRISVEVGGRVGPDSGPHADAQRRNHEVAS